MESIVIGVLLAFLGYLILYFVIKSAVREGIKEAYAERKSNSCAAGEAGAILEKAEEETEERKEELHE